MHTGFPVRGRFRCTFTFTCMHLADAFIQSDLKCIQAIHFLSVCIGLGVEKYSLVSISISNRASKSNRSLWKVPTIHRNKRVCVIRKQVWQRSVGRKVGGLSNVRRNKRGCRFWKWLFAFCIGNKWKLSKAIMTWVLNLWKIKLKLRWDYINKESICSLNCKE